jgi:hypothetical protein
MPRYELSREGHMLKFEGGGAGRPLNKGQDSTTEPPDKSNSETLDRTNWLDYRVKYTLGSLRALVVSRDPTFKTKKRKTQDGIIKRFAKACEKRKLWEYRSNLATPPHPSGQEELSVQEPESDTLSGNQAEARITLMDPSVSVYSPTTTQSDPPSRPPDPHTATLPFCETSPHWPAITSYHAEGSRQIERYIFRSLLRTNQIFAIDRESLLAKLKKLFDQAKDDKIIGGLDWDLMPLPQGMVVEEGDEVSGD